jgi:Lhr-like helicase
MVRQQGLVSPAPHQLELLARAQARRDALLIAPTGAGKTLAGFLPSLIDLADRPARASSRPGDLHTLYISPLKALAVDVARNLTTPPRRWVCRCASKRAPATRPPRAASGRNATRPISC